MNIYKDDDVYFPECEYCRGSGKETIWTYSTNHPGTKHGNKTRKKCLFCYGRGYSPIPCGIKEVEKKRKG